VNVISGITIDQTKLQLLRGAHLDLVFTHLSRAPARRGLEVRWSYLHVSMFQGEGSPPFTQPKNNPPDSPFLSSMTDNITDTGEDKHNDCAPQADDNDEPPPLEPAHNDGLYILPDYFDYCAYSSACLRPRRY
jgi:hypothetical protein